jgi:hypothetical protein
MAFQPVVGPFPITYVSEDTTNLATLGMQQQIPLSLIEYDATQSPPIQITNGPTGTDFTVVQAIVVALIKQSILKVQSP